MIFYKDYFNGMPYQVDDADVSCNRIGTARLYLSNDTVWLASAPISNISFQSNSTFDKLEPRFAERIGKSIEEGKEMLEGFEGAASSVLSLLSNLAGRNKQEILNFMKQDNFVSNALRGYVNEDSIDKFVNWAGSTAQSMSNELKSGNLSRKHFGDIYKGFLDGEVSDPIDRISCTVFSSASLSDIIKKLYPSGSVSGINIADQPLKAYMLHLLNNLSPSYVIKEAGNIKGMGACMEIRAPCGFKRPVASTVETANILVTNPDDENSKKVEEEVNVNTSDGEKGDSNGKVHRYVVTGCGIIGGCILHINDKMILRHLVPTSIKINPAPAKTPNGDILAADIEIAFKCASMRTGYELKRFVKDF